MKNNIESKIASQTKIVGMVSPPYRSLTLKEEANYLFQIRKSKADVLWLGLSSPKQVILASRWKKLLPNTCIFCVGAAFDFLADKQPMAPRIVQAVGFEWLFRLLVSPKRLWRRYLVTIPTFLVKNFFSSL